MKNWALSGYTKSLQGLYWIKEPTFGIDEVINDVFLHNRLNFKWFLHKNWTFKAELRTRFFFGELSKSNFFPDFKENLKEGNNDVLNLQWLNLGNQVILNSVFDRLYLEYSKEKWEVRLGRQRINWGINTVWNPHDIFNAFTFTDFDYEERPGADALRIKYYTGVASSLELAFKAFGDTEKIVGGLLWKANKWNYDFQTLAGWANRDVVLGVGWAGAIKNVGFKGEMSGFLSTNDAVAHTFAGTVSFDYIFKKGMYLSWGLLYNATENTNSNLFAFDLSARNLYPYKWASIVSLSHPITPLFTGALAIIYSPVEAHPLFINPTLTYSISQNVDINLIGQIFLQQNANKYRSPINIAYLRIKWSF